MTSETNPTNPAPTDPAPTNPAPTATTPAETTHHIRIHAKNAATITVVIAIAVAASFITSTAIAGRAYLKRGDQNNADARTINVTGYARQRIRADLGEWRITLAGRGDNLENAYNILETSLAALNTFLIERGFTEPDINLLPIATTTHMLRDDRGRDTEDIAGYTLRRTAVIKTKHVDLIAASAGAVTELLKQNIEIQSNAPDYTVSDLDQFKITIAGQASADARRRAEAIATEADCKVTDVRDARLGVIQITQPDSTEVRSYGMYDTTTIDKDIAVTVTLRLGIEPAR